MQKLNLNNIDMIFNFTLIFYSKLTWEPSFAWNLNFLYKSKSSQLKICLNQEKNISVVLQGILVPKLTLGPFLTLFQEYITLFQEYISLNTRQVEQEYTIYL